MDQNIKKLISEAFNELYDEMMNEAPQTLRKNKIDDNEVDTIIQNSLRRGTPVPDYDSEHEPSRINHDKIIDALVNDYKATGNPKAKEAIQSSFYPVPGSRLYRTIGIKYLKNPDLQDAMSRAYEQIVLNKFDTLVSDYNPKISTFGSRITDAMRKLLHNYLVVGNRSGEGKKYDAVAGGNRPMRLDNPLGDDGDATLGDKLASNMLDDPETAMEKGFAKEKAIQNKRDIIQDVVKWLDNTFEEEGDETGKRRMIAFKGILDGASPEEIFEDNPGVFKEPRYVSIEFERLVNSPEAKEISRMISQIYGINFNLSNIDPKKMKQTSSMSPEFGGFSKYVRQATPEMQNAQKELNNALGAAGLKNTDFNSKKKREDVISNLRAKGMDAELEAILDAEKFLDDATKKAKAAGEYDVKVPVLPSSPEEERASGERMYEGVDFEKLMERVLKRISGK